VSERRHVVIVGGGLEWRSAFAAARPPNPPPTITT